MDHWAGQCSTKIRHVICFMYLFIFWSVFVFLIHMRLFQSSGINIYTSSFGWCYSLRIKSTWGTIRRAVCKSWDLNSFPSLRRCPVLIYPAPALSSGCLANLWWDSISFPSVSVSSQSPPKSLCATLLWLNAVSRSLRRLSRVTSHLAVLLFATTCACLCNLWNWQESSKSIPESRHPYGNGLLLMDK